MALEMTDGVEALFLTSGTPDDIADAANGSLRTRRSARRLGEGGAAFARKHFDLEANTAGLIKTYERVSALAPRKCWDVVRETDAPRTSPSPPGSWPTALQAHRSKDGAGAADLASLAADLASIVRLEDERQSSAAADKGPGAGETGGNSCAISNSNGS